MIDSSLHEELQKVSPYFMSSDFDQYWKEQLEAIAWDNITYELRKIAFQTSRASYYEIEFLSYDKTKIYAKYVKPNCREFPLVLEFQDVGEPVQNWHSLTTYALLDMGVIAMACRNEGAGSPMSKGIRATNSEAREMLLSHYLDAYILTRIVSSLPTITALHTHGIGRGATIAAFVAAFHQDIQKCSLLNILIPNDDEESVPYEDQIRYLDPHHFAGIIKSKVLMGTGMQDTQCLPSTQFSFYKKLTCKRRQLLFQKYGHNRIDEYENRYLAFLQEE